MAFFLKQSTAATVQMGPFIAPSDGYSLVTGLSPAVYLSKAGAAFAARNSASAIAYDAYGHYRVPLDATDTATLGNLRLVVVSASTHYFVQENFIVLPANVYNSLVSGTDYLDVATAEIANTPSTKVADVTLRRAIGSALDSADGDTKTFRSLAGAVSRLVNKTAVSGSTFSVYEEDDSTVLGTMTVTTDANASPITAMDTD